MSLRHRPGMAVNEYGTGSLGSGMRSMGAQGSDQVILHARREWFAPGMNWAKTGMAAQWVTRTETAEAISQWYARASVACTPFIFPEARFRSPWVDDQFSDDLQRVRRWVTD